MVAAPFLIPKLSPHFNATITLPGSKSIALRQLALAALCQGVSKIYGIPECDDTSAMLECLNRLGATTVEQQDHIEVHGPMTRDTPVTLNARMSGASTRLLIGLAALRSGTTLIDGHSSLRARTNAPLLDVLQRHGCQVHSDAGKLPVKLQGPIKPPDQLVIDGSLSSQYVTALLLCAPEFSAGSTLEIRIQGDLVSRPYIDITLNEMSKRGGQAYWQDSQTLIVHRRAYTPGNVTIEGDATAATYFAGLAGIHGGTITLTNLGNGSVQGDFNFFAVMEALGAKVDRHPEHTQIKGPSALNSLPAIDMNSMPDAALTLIALAPLIPGDTHITGLSSLHHKECDRLNCPAQEFKALGVHPNLTDDTITVPQLPPQLLRPHVLNTYHDHRMAMAFSLLGSVSGHLKIDHKPVVDKTYPQYWSDYSRLV